MILDHMVITSGKTPSARFSKPWSHFDVVAPCPTTAENAPTTRFCGLAEPGTFVSFSPQSFKR